MCLRDSSSTVLTDEMEASGVADGAWTAALSYIVIRGISDYCDMHKNDRWQGYAAMVAAAYACSLIEAVPLRHDSTSSQEY